MTTCSQTRLAEVFDDRCQEDYKSLWTQWHRFFDFFKRTEPTTRFENPLACAECPLVSTRALLVELIELLSVIWALWLRQSGTAGTRHQNYFGESAEEPKRQVISFFSKDLPALLCPRTCVCERTKKKKWSMEKKLSWQLFCILILHSPFCFPSACRHEKTAQIYWGRSSES